MPITEAQRSEMVNELSAATSPKTVETLMKCVLPDGRDHLATKDDLKVLEHGLRADFAELKGYVNSALAKQTRLIMTTLVGFMIATWTPMLVFLAA